MWEWAWCFCSTQVLKPKLIGSIYFLLYLNYDNDFKYHWYPISFKMHDVVVKNHAYGFKVLCSNLFNDNCFHIWMTSLDESFKEVIFKGEDGVWRCNLASLLEPSYSKKNNSSLGNEDWAYPKFPREFGYTSRGKVRWESIDPFTNWPPFDGQVAQRKKKLETSSWELELNVPQLVPQCKMILCYQ